MQILYFPSTGVYLPRPTAGQRSEQMKPPQPTTEPFRFALPCLTALPHRANRTAPFNLRPESPADLNTTYYPNVVITGVPDLSDCLAFGDDVCIGQYYPDRVSRWIIDGNEVASYIRGRVWCISLFYLVFRCISRSPDRWILGLRGPCHSVRVAAARRNFVVTQTHPW
jgi:hypothetical protein